MKIVYAIKEPNKIISEIDYVALHKYIVNKISIEFSEMVQNCYYPKVPQMYKDLLHMTHSKEKDLLEYAKEKYRVHTQGIKSKFQMLYDPYTILLILVIQEFLSKKDLAAAESTFHLWALKFYTNLLYRYTTPPGSRKALCIPDAFQAAMDHLSKNHMFSKQKTIPNSIIYYSRAVFKLNLKNLANDDAPAIADMIYSLRTRINQSMRSFFNKYYAAIKEDKMAKSEGEGKGEYDPSHEQKLRSFISTITQDMCVYGKIDASAVNNASSLIKFNKKLSEEYAKKLASPVYKDQLETAFYLLLKDLKDISFIKSNEFLDHIQKLMSIKVTKQQIYFKKVITEIHFSIIKQLKLDKWFDELSIQSKSISRNFIAYYLAFFLRNYI